MIKPLPPALFLTWVPPPLLDNVKKCKIGTVGYPLQKHYNAFVNVQNKDHEKQIFSKILPLPATRHNILHGSGTRPHLESKHILQAIILSRKTLK